MVTLHTERHFGTKCPQGLINVESMLIEGFVPAGFICVTTWRFHDLLDSGFRDLLDSVHAYSVLTSILIHSRFRDLLDTVRAYSVPTNVC